MLALAMKSNGFCDEGTTALRPRFGRSRPLKNQPKADILSALSRARDLLSSADL